jgi:ribosome-associated toxin RatA of RatAB toxin-antitoxin module
LVPGKIKAGSINDPFHTFNQTWHIEIDEQTDVEASIGVEIELEPWAPGE